MTLLHPLALAVVLGAGDAHFLLLDVLAVGVVAAGGEFPVAAVLDDQLAFALRALLVEELIALGLERPVLSSQDPPGVLALGVAGAGEELPVAALLQHHRTAALLAGLVLEDVGVRGLLVGIVLDLAGVAAIGITGAGEAMAE